MITEDNKGFVSIVCACMNREDTLKVTLASWLKFKEVGEIVIVDWCSTNNLEWAIDLDDRIKLIRVNNQPYFNIAKAYNLAIDNSTKDYVLKMDVDYLLNPYYNFFELHPRPEEECYYTGNWATSDGDPIFKHLHGLIYAKRSGLIEAEGYNENFEGYGWDDDDLYGVMTSMGKKRIDINHDYSIMHIVHGEKVRTENYKDKRTRSSARQNKRLKTSIRRIIKWNLSQKSERFYFAEILST
jgi:glycosyltransferase involved in cell wall biosynthesis